MVNPPQGGIGEVVKSQSALSMPLATDSVGRTLAPERVINSTGVARRVETYAGALGMWA